MTDNPIRCFVAIDFSPETKVYIQSVIEKNKIRFPQARWVSTDQIHITLQFFPSLTSSRVDQMKTILAEISASFNAFELIVLQIGVFSSWKKVRVLWIGIDPVAGEKLKKIALYLVKECTAQNIDIDQSREFSPHLTLARFKDPISIQPQQLYQPTCYTTSIRHLSFYQSTLTPRGPIYTPLMIMPLKEVN